METTTLSNKDLIDQHGKAGSMFLALRRNGFIGWIAFFMMLLTLIVFVIVDKLSPVPILVINERGEAVGVINYHDERIRSEEQLSRSAKSWLESYLSLNSATIFEDAAIALNHMSSDLRKTKLEEYELTNYLAQISNAGERSRVVYDEETGFELVHWKGDNVMVRLRGAIVIGLSNPIESAFDTTLAIRLKASTSTKPLGIEVEEVEDN